jgi:hypothetical protein
MGAMLTFLAECMTSAGLETHVTGPTFCSFSSFRPRGDPLSPAGDLPSPTGDGTRPAGGGQSPAGSGPSPAGDYHRYSRLDHFYTKGLISESVVLPNSTTDHRPVVTTVRAKNHVPGAEKLVSLKRQNVKAVTRPELEGALNLTDWSEVYDLKDVDAVLEYITAGITSALNIVAPQKAIRVKKGLNLHLTRETIETMKKRNAATGKRYRSLRNKVTRLVRRDKQDSNLLSLAKAKNDPKVLWGLADQALVKDLPSLPASVTGAEGNDRTTPLEAAKAVNRYFVDKVYALRKKALLPQGDAPNVSEEVPKVSEEVPNVTEEVPYDRQDVGHVPQEVGNVPQKVSNIQQEAAANITSGRHVPKFFIKFANTKRISKMIKGLNNTEALGMDGIPTSVLKKGVEVLAGPISHLVNRSMAEGRVPANFKIGRVHLIHKGKGKPLEDPASYRPVSILPVLSW